MIDRILLFLLALEYLLFGLWGHYDPVGMSNIVGFTFNEITSYSEFRAQYAFFTACGILSFVAIFKIEFRVITYFILALLNGSFIVGRSIGILLDGQPDQLLWTIFFVDLLVFLICSWRYIALKGSS